MTEPTNPLITLLGAPGAACEGDDCLVDEPAADENTDEGRQLP